MWDSIIIGGKNMSCYVYWDKIKSIANSLNKCNQSEFHDLPLKKIMPLLDSVEVIAHDKTIDFDSAKHILDDEHMNKALKIIRKFYVNLGSRLETEQALAILEAEDPWKIIESFHFYKRYQGLIKNENKLVKFSTDETVIFIGGGPFPLSLILLNKFFGCKCISIEIIPEVAELSKKVISKLGLSSDIEVLVGDEKLLKDIDYDILMVAALAEPKEKVFANIWGLVDTSTPIIYRTYTGMRAILYSPVTEKATRGFHKEVMILPTGQINNTSVLIRKVV
jgi:hypothetical protein